MEDKIKLTLKPKAHNIFCIDLERVERITPFLEELTNEGSLYGKRSDGYFIVNTDLQISPNGNYDIDYFNAFLHNCRMRNYNSLLILKQTTCTGNTEEKTATETTLKTD